MPPVEPATSAALDPLVATIDTKQSEELVASKPYWQGAKTRDDSTAKVSDHDSWETKGIALGAIDEDVQVHTYVGPHGSGYIIIMEKPVDGGRYIKKVVNGPEQERGHDWRFSQTTNGSAS
jgi:hypothetical protein